ncbi:MAG: hypothetical protein Fur0032_24480 [Terrimicrobiaceae bacterium]
MRFALLIPLIVAFVAMEIFIGGARLAYALPGICLIALAGLFTALPRTPWNPRANVWALASAILFSAYIVVRNRLSEIEYIGRLQLAIIAGALLLYLLFAIFLSKPQDRKFFLYALMVMALVQVLVGAAQFAENNQWMPLPWAQRRDDFWRASGFFISPNHFSGYLEIVGLMSLALVVWGRMGIVVRLLVGYVAVVCIAGIAISGSRGGYLSFTFGACVLMVLTLVAWAKLRPQKFPVIAGISIGAAVALFVGVVTIMFQSQTVRDRVIAINDPENMRWLLWDSAIQQFLYSPWVGTGGFSFLYFGRMYRNPLVQNDPIHVHNDYLQLLADYGLVGMLLFLLFLIVHLAAGGIAFKKLVRVAEVNQDTQGDALALNIGAISCVAAYLVHSVVDFNAQIPVNGILLGFVFAILANSRRVPPPDEFEVVPGVLSARWLLPVISVAVLAAGSPYIYPEYLGERARVALRDGHFTEALDFARKATTSDPGNPDLFYYAGESARESAVNKLGDPRSLINESIGYFSRGLEIFPYDSRLALKLGQAHSNAGNYFEASSAISYAEDVDPNSSLVRTYRGYIELAGGYFPDAENAFQEAIELGGEGGRLALQGLKLTQEAMQKEEEALTDPALNELIQKLQSLPPGEPENPGDLEPTPSAGEAAP